MEAIVTTTDGFENESSEPIPVVAEIPESATPAVEAVAEETETEETDDAASEAGRQLAKKKQSLQSRIDAITREKHDSIRERDTAKAESARLKQELDALKAPKTAQAAVPDAQDADFPDYEKWSASNPDKAYEQYLRALLKHDRDAEVAADRRAKEDLDEKENSERLVSDFHKRGREKFADFDATVDSFAAAGIKFSQPITIALVNEPLGPEILQYLKGDPETAKRIAPLTNHVAAGVQIGRIIAKLETAPPGPVSTPKPISQAKPVIKPVTTTPPAPDSDELSDDDDFDTHYRKMNAADRRKERGH